MQDMKFNKTGREAIARTMLQIPVGTPEREQVDEICKRADATQLRR